MTVPKDFVIQLLAPVVKWLASGGDAWAMDVAYWERRRQLLKELLGAGEPFEGPAASVLSNIDTAMDVFRPDPDPGPHQIDEVQLREELTAAIAKLRVLGYEL